MVQSWIVVAIAPVSWGFLSFVGFWYAALRMRSRLVALCAAGYTIASALEYAWPETENGNPAPGSYWIMAVTLIVGTGHLIAIRGRLARALQGATTAHDL